MCYNVIRINHMPVDKEFLNKAVKIVKDNFGEYTANMYENTFINKSENEIIVIVREILTEFVGPENAAKQIEELMKK